MLVLFVRCIWSYYSLAWTFFLSKRYSNNSVPLCHYRYSCDVDFSIIIEFRMINKTIVFVTVIVPGVFTSAPIFQSEILSM